MDLKISITDLDSPAYRDNMVAFIKAIVAQYYKVSPEIYDIESRKTDVIRIKHTAIWFIHQNIKITTVELGKRFGCDHSTIIAIQRKFKGYLEWDKKVIKEFAEIQKIITFKSRAEASEHLNKDYYFIDLNDLKSLKYGNKAILFSGFTEEEIAALFAGKNMAGSDLRDHTNTGMYIMEKRNKNKHEQ